MKMLSNFVSSFLLLTATLTLMSMLACSTSASPSDHATSHAPKPPKRTLQEAAFMGDVDLMQAHIDAGSDLNQKDEFGATPLIIATTFGKTDVAKQLIQAGADVNATGSDGGTALHGAAFYCRIDIVKALLAKGADTSIRNLYGATALESVSSPFEEVKMVYDQLSKDLGPMGFRLDYGYLKDARPQVAEMILQAK